MSFESELAAIRATGANPTEQDIASLRQRYVPDADTLFDGKNDHDTEELSDISQRDRDNLKKYVFNSATSFEYPLKVGERDSKNPEQLHSIRFTILARENSRAATAQNQDKRALQTMERDWQGPVFELEAVDVHEKALSKSNCPFPFA